MSRNIQDIRHKPDTGLLSKEANKVADATSHVLTPDALALTLVRNLR